MLLFSGQSFFWTIVPPFLAYYYYCFAVEAYSSSPSITAVKLQLALSNCCSWGPANTSGAYFGSSIEDAFKPAGSFEVAFGSVEASLDGERGIVGTSIGTSSIISDSH